MSVLKWVSNNGCRFYCDADVYPFYFSVFQYPAGKVNLSIRVGDAEEEESIGNYKTMQEAQEAAERYLLEEITIIANSVGYNLVKKD